MTHLAPKNSRTVARRLVAAVSVGIIASVLLPASAIADTPEAWPADPHVSGLQFLVVLVLIPAALFVVITLLAALPSMVSDKGYEPGQAWRSEAEWFGGPSDKGVEAAGSATPAQIEAADAERGGTSGTW